MRQKMISSLSEPELGSTSATACLILFLLFYHRTIVLSEAHKMNPSFPFQRTTKLREG